MKGFEGGCSKNILREIEESVQTHQSTTELLKKEKTMQQIRYQLYIYYARSATK
jgi:hypothetical protein